jgi:hypothetical protein
MIRSNFVNYMNKNGTLLIEILKLKINTAVKIDFFAANTYELYINTRKLT